MPCLVRHANHQEHDSGDFFSVLWGSSACGVTLHRSSVWRRLGTFSRGVVLWLLLPNNEERYTMRAFVVKMPLHRVLHDFIGTQPTAGTTPTAVIVRAFPLRA